jgi:uncharacterized protein (TIGR03086 family)
VDEFSSAEAALRAVLDTVEVVDDDDLHRPTPCRDFDVSALAEHLIDTIIRLGTAAGIEHQDTDGQSIAQRILHVTHTVLAGLRRRGLGGDITFSGRALPGRLALGILSLELAVHGWDFAVALNRSLDMTDALAAHILGLAHHTLTAESRVKAGFDPPLPAPQTASPLDKLVAFTGRDPNLQLPQHP